MSDFTANGLGSTRTKAPGFEYRIYFAIIFMISLPWALASWALGLAKPDSEDAQHGVIGRAWRRAAIITPMIFSA